MHMRGRPMVQRALLLAMLSVATTMVVIAPAGAERSRPEASDEQHCVAAVQQLASGELSFTAETCHNTFAEALADATAGTVALPSDLEGADLFADEIIGQLAASFTLGIHFDGYGGSGSSIAIVGSSCTGGYWNASSWWRNRINSSWNGCYHLRHYDNPSRSGASYNTYTAGQIDSLSWFANRTESVAYYAW